MPPQMLEVDVLKPGSTWTAKRLSSTTREPAEPQENRPTPEENKQPAEPPVFALHRAETRLVASQSKAASLALWLTRLQRTVDEMHTTKLSHQSRWTLPFVRNQWARRCLARDPRRALALAHIMALHMVLPQECDEDFHIRTLLLVDLRFPASWTQPVCTHSLHISCSHTNTSRRSLKSQLIR